MTVNQFVVRTPEGITFSQVLAGPMTRFLAWLVDCSVVIGICWVLGMLLGTLVLISPDLAKAVTALSYFVISVGYSIVLEWIWRGQTFGKRILRLRVVDAEGLRLQLNQVVMRNLLRFIDMLPAFYLIGGIACVCSRRWQRLGDLAANTVVVRAPRLSEPDLEQLLAGKFNSLRGYPHLEARLRQRVSATEAAIAMRALLRRDGLEPKARVELFAELADHFRRLVPFPAEAVEGMPDEQYVRNVVDVLYRAKR
ncbi:MAG: RDD family protein [Verrucomicrobia subdivision 3 bacterium]|nr:RDD family protein [Limisphaerales bacterium]